MVSKKGNILMDNLVFILIVLVFFSILVGFLLRQGDGVILLEQSYAKQIALDIDASNPGDFFQIDLSDAKKVAEKNGLDFTEIIEIEDNLVKVKLSKKSGYEYSFFNNVEINKNIDGNFYYFIISNKNLERLNEN